MEKSEVCALLFVLSLVEFFGSSKAQVIPIISCNTAYTFAPVIAFELNLIRTLVSLAANASVSGFVTATTGKDPDVVYGLIECRAYMNQGICQTCADTAARQVHQICPNQKEAFAVYEACSLQYSYRRFFSTIDSSLRLALCSASNISNPLFNSVLQKLLNKVSSTAAASPSRLALGNSSYNDNTSIYAAAQCIITLEDSGCSACLRDLAGCIPASCLGKQGLRLLALSCSLIHEIYPFPMDYFPSPRQPTPTPPSPSRSHHGSDSKTIIIAVVIPGAAAVAVISILFSYFLWRRYSTILLDSESIASLFISLRTLRAATDNFNNDHKLGQGGFGSVYKGRLPDGQEIAVKRLSSSSEQGLEELKTEILVVAKVLHLNLVRLLGFCLEDGEKLLFYEFMPNGSLDKVLFDHCKWFNLEWEGRYKIIVGIARGLVYLHDDSQLRVIHRDLKASNILLDKDMNPKISDFDLAKLSSGSKAHGSTVRIVGTYGYMAPEYVQKGHFSPKSDVYSFGVLVLEILTGRKNSSFSNAINLSNHAWYHWNNGTTSKISDPTLGNNWPRDEVLKCIKIGLLSVQERVANRPSMSEVIMMLSNYNTTPPGLTRPAYNAPRKNPSPVSAKEGGGASKPGTSVQGFLNDFAISELHTLWGVKCTVQSSNRVDFRNSRSPSLFL